MCKYIEYNDLKAIDKLSTKLVDSFDNNTIIICIGTDKHIGDCLGPLVGTILKEMNVPINVFGTLKQPIHALNINKKYKEIINNYPDYKVIAIDACLGEDKNIGNIFVKENGISPGKGVGKELPHVKGLGIAGIIDSSDNSESFITKPIRLSFIKDMAEVIANSLIKAYEIKNKKELILCE